jgi:hypothetical protein
MLPDRIALLATLPQGSTVAEIGVHKGYFSNDILSLPNYSHVYLIDSWKPRPEYFDPITQEDHDANFEETKRTIQGHNSGGRFTIIRKDSLDAAKDFSDGQITGAYIDADHSYDACLKDLIAWSRVVGPKGYLMGHDYTENSQARKFRFGVVRAVTDFCIQYKWRVTHLTNEDFASFCLLKE